MKKIGYKKDLIVYTETFLSLSDTGFPSHTGPKIRHKPRPSQTNSSKKAKQHPQTAQAAQKRKSSDQQAGVDIDFISFQSLILLMLFL